MGSAVSSNITSDNGEEDCSTSDFKSSHYVENDNDGIIPRVIKNLFQMIYEKEQDTNNTYKIFVQFLEIYGEDIKDLLDETKTSKVVIRETPNGEVFVSGAREELVTSYEQMIKCLEDGTKHRSTAATKMNSTSSRSHAIFTITIEHTIHTPSTANASEELQDEEGSQQQHQKPLTAATKGQAEVRRSKFHFVDLAGSERAKRTGAQGATMKEGIDINKGLLALGNVISALGDDSKRGKVFVPYRDSKLTRILQDSLGGNSKTLMICCVSPANINYSESVNALRYANRARNIKNKPVLNRDPTLVAVDELKRLLAIVSAELLEIKKQKRYDESSDGGLSVAQLEAWCDVGTGTGSGTQILSNITSELFPNSNSTKQNNRKSVSASGGSVGGANKDRIEAQSLRRQLVASDFEMRRLQDQLSSLRKELSHQSDEMVQVKSELCYFKHKWEEACPEESKALASASRSSEDIDTIAGSTTDIDLVGAGRVADSALAAKLLEEKRQITSASAQYIREADALRRQLAAERQHKRVRRSKKDKDDDSAGADAGLDMDEMTLTAASGESLFSLPDEDTSSIELLIAQTREQLEMEYIRLKDAISDSSAERPSNLSQSPDSVASSATGRMEVTNLTLCELVEDSLQSTAVEDDAKEYNHRRKVLSTEMSELEQSIQLKEQLLEQLTKSQSQYSAMKAFYEQKLLLLSEEMSIKQEERDVLLQELQAQLHLEQAHSEGSAVPDSATVKANKDKERILTAQLAKKDEELRALKKRQEELSHLSQVQSRYVLQKQQLEESISAMKKQKVSLTREFQLQRKRYTASLNDKAREIDKLKRELLKSASQVKKLSKDKEAAEIRARDAYLSRLAISAAAASNNSRKQSRTRTYPSPVPSHGNSINRDDSGVSTMPALKAMKKVARITRKLQGGSIGRIFSSEDIHTKKWLDKRLLTISQEEAAADIVKRLCDAQMILLNKKSLIEKDLDSQQGDSADLMERMLQLDSRIDEMEKQISEVEGQINHDGEARAIFYEKTLEVLLRNASQGSLSGSGNAQQIQIVHNLIRLLFDMLVTSYKRIQLSVVEEAEFEEREKKLKTTIEQLQSELTSARRLYECNLTTLSTDYEQKLEGLFKNINETSITLLQCPSPINSPPSSPSFRSPSNSRSTSNSNIRRDYDGESNSNPSQARSSSISGSSGLESVQLSLVLEEVNLLRAQLARSSVTHAQLASQCSDLQGTNQRLSRDNEDKDFQIKFLEEDRALFKDMVDDLKASLLAMGKEGKNIIDTVKDRATQNRRHVKGASFSSSAGSGGLYVDCATLLGDAEEDEDVDDGEDSWDPVSTHIILDEFDLITDEIRFGEWPQGNSSSSSNINSSSSGEPIGNSRAGKSITAYPPLPPSIPPSLLQSTGAPPLTVPVYDRLANPSYYTGHMRNVFDDKNIEQKRKKVQKIKSQERKVVSTSADWGAGSISSSKKTGGNGDSAGDGDDSSPRAASHPSQTPSAKLQRSNTMTINSTAGSTNTGTGGGLTAAQRQKRILNRANSADWVMAEAVAALAMVQQQHQLQQASNINANAGVAAASSSVRAPSAARHSSPRAERRRASIGPSAQQGSRKATPTQSSTSGDLDTASTTLETYNLREDPNSIYIHEI